MKRASVTQPIIKHLQHLNWPIGTLMPKSAETIHYTITGTMYIHNMMRPRSTHYTSNCLVSSLSFQFFDFTVVLWALRGDTEAASTMPSRRVAVEIWWLVQTSLRQTASRNRAYLRCPLGEWGGAWYDRESAVWGARVVEGGWGVYFDWSGEVILMLAEDLLLGWKCGWVCWPQAVKPRPDLAFGTWNQTPDTCTLGLLQHFHKYAVLLWLLRLPKIICALKYIYILVYTVIS